MNKRMLKRVKRFISMYGAIILFYGVIVLGVLVLNARFEYLNSIIG